MKEPIEKVGELLNVWQKRNIQGLFVPDRTEAYKKLMELIPVSASVGISGSQTLEQLGVVKGLAARGTPVINQYKPGISSEESMELRKQGILADYFLASANAISGTGELVFFSANGTRTAGVAQGNNVIIVAGINKIAGDMNEALKRAREYATPLNCKRLNWNTPCFQDGICRQSICFSPEYKRMCCQILIIETEAAPERLKVILVGESLGY
ncbi:MAG: lactate utilization protein [Candidatus Omnitrophica bacterium]|nr:lactate utilization protein [Candidatus Omnitrophota bacterium]